MRRFYCVIIGTEILLGRRIDKHFEFVKNELEKRNFELSGSFVVKDDEILLKNIFSMFKDDKDAVVFCFGGIGATPDDLTRKISAEVFTCKDLVENKEAKKLIIQTFKDEAYPHRIKMSHLPQNAKLLTNIINQVPGFSLEDRLFFMPGFPQMSHPMVVEALDLYIGKNDLQMFTCKKKIYAKENDLMPFMMLVPKDIELSSLPHLCKNDDFMLEFMLRCEDDALLQIWNKKLKNFLQEKNINYENLI